MELAKLSKKGQLSIPRAVLRQVGITGETPVLVEGTDDGAIVIRAAAVYPIEVYSDERVEEFLAADALNPEQEQRLRRWGTGVRWESELCEVALEHGEDPKRHPRDHSQGD